MFLFANDIICVYLLIVYHHRGMYVLMRPELHKMTRFKVCGKLQVMIRKRWQSGLFWKDQLFSRCVETRPVPSVDALDQARMCWKNEWKSFQKWSKTSLVKLLTVFRSDLFYAKEISQNVRMDRLLNILSLFVWTLRGTCCALFCLWLISAAYGAAARAGRCAVKTSAVRGVGRAILCRVNNVW